MGGSPVAIMAEEKVKVVSKGHYLHKEAAAKEGQQAPELAAPEPVSWLSWLIWLPWRNITSPIRLVFWLLMLPLRFAYWLPFKMIHKLIAIFVPDKVNHLLEFTEEMQHHKRKAHKAWTSFSKSVDAGEKEYEVYKFEVSVGNVSQEISGRYSALHALHESLEEAKVINGATYSTVNGPTYGQVLDEGDQVSFPRKHRVTSLLGVYNLDTRQSELVEWLEALLNVRGTMNNATIQDALDFNKKMRKKGYQMLHPPSKAWYYILWLHVFAFVFSAKAVIFIKLIAPRLGLSNEWNELFVQLQELLN